MWGPFHWTHSQRRLLMLAAVAITASPAALRAQQRNPEPTTKTGTLVGIEKQGRAQALRITNDAGEEQSLVLTPKIQAYVEAPGDASFLRPGQFIAALATESNNQLFAKEVTVVPVGKGRPPIGKIQKAPKKSGQSVNAYQVTGTINAIGPDTDYPEYQRIDVKAVGPKAPLMLEEGFKVTVRLKDFGLAPEGTPIEIQGHELRNGRFVVAKVVATLDKPIEASKVFGDTEAGQPAAEK